MKSADAGPHLFARRLGKGLGVLIVAMTLLLVTTVSAFAATVHMYDNARVLNGQVQSEAQSLNYPVDIYTITNYTASGSAFDRAADSKLTSNNLIIIAINTTPGHGHIRVHGGSSVPLKSSDYDNAASAFSSNYKSKGYTGATIATIGSLRDSLNSRSGSGFPGTGGGFNFGGVWCCIGVLVLLGVLFFVIIRRRRGGSGGGGGFFGGPGGGFFNRNRNMPPPPNYNQPQYGQPPYGGYNQGYPPPPNQGGMNPWAAGGLGAAAGGLLGYELGKNAGENEARRDDQGGGGDFGGGGGGSADFDNSGGGDFGGGGSADFGGGGDFGGGDSGGGSSDF